MQKKNWRQNPGLHCWHTEALAFQTKQLSEKVGWLSTKPIWKAKKQIKINVRNEFIHFLQQQLLYIVYQAKRILNRIYRLDLFLKMIKEILLFIMITSLGVNIHYFFWNFKMATVPLAIYYITAPNIQEAQKLSTVLLNHKLIACCNIVKDVKSIYEWQGKVQNSNEVLMIMKSRQQLLHQITKVVQENHSYDTPEVIAMPILGGSQKYIKWVLDSTQTKFQNL